MITIKKPIKMSQTDAGIVLTGGKNLVVDGVTRWCDSTNTIPLVEDDSVQRSGDTMTGDLTLEQNLHLYGNLLDGVNIGSSTLYWLNAYIKNYNFENGGKIFSDSTGVRIYSDSTHRAVTYTNSMIYVDRPVGPNGNEAVLDLGGTSNPWRDLYLSGKVYTNEINAGTTGNLTLATNYASIICKGWLVPQSTGFELGSSSSHWSKGYVNKIVGSDGVEKDVSDLGPSPNVVRLI